MIAENAVKRRLASGKVVLGSFCIEFKTLGIGRLSAAAGAEFLVYDMEHTGWGAETIATLIASSGPDLVPIVRVPSAQANWIGPVLDVGALGIMVPMVGDADHARAVVAAVKYPPAGRRGCVFGVGADDYALPSAPGDAMRKANDETLVAVQIETRAGLDNLEEIAAVEGVDVLWVGQADLTASLGKPFQFDDREFLDSIERVADVAQRNGKAAAYLALSLDEARRMLDLGFRLIAYGADLWLYQQAVREGLDALR